MPTRPQAAAATRTLGILLISWDRRLSTWPGPGDYHSIERQAPYSSNRPGVPMRTKPCLTSADVKKMMAACAAEAEKNKWKVAIAIVDDGAALLGLERMDGAPAISATVAPGKAKTSALTKQPP